MLFFYFTGTTRTTWDISLVTIIRQVIQHHVCIIVIVLFESSNQLTKTKRKMLVINTYECTNYIKVHKFTVILQY